MTAIVAAIVALAAGLTAYEQAAPQALTIAAASDLQTVMPELASGFERSVNAKVTVSFGSSGNFFAQIQNGAPFDVFFSADIEYPKQLVASGHADAMSLYRYATGKIVLWARGDSGIDVKRGLIGLTDARVRRIAMANPQHAPYGRAAEAALRHDKVYDAVKSKLVLGENIAQTVQLVDSGNADAGIVSLSHALSPLLRSHGTYFEIPSSAYPPIEQAAVVLTSSTNKPLARQFLDYVKRPEIRRRLQQLGFATS